MSIKPQTQAHKDYILEQLSAITGLKGERVKFGHTGKNGGGYPVLVWLEGRTYWSRDGQHFHRHDSSMHYHTIEIIPYNPKKG